MIERLGIGGMATVHRALERGIEGFERVVALKRLLPHLAEDEAFVRAFVREAKLASLLQHANIVQLYELGRVGSSYFISMEYIRGRDTRRILRQAKRVTGPVPVPIAIAIVAELLDALDYAHTRADENGTPLGLVHRDISPSNLLISHTGHLKVIDFGIAKATLGHLQTHTGRIKGKLSYMAPEALTGKALDNRSDLFSASIIAHELLTAHPLFAARNDFHTIDRVQTMEAPPPSERNPEVPPSLDALVLRGLSKDPAQRWRTAGEMRSALAEISLHHRMHCTNREVADWIEIAFALGHSQELAPGAPLALASQRPLPLSAEATGGGTQPYGLVPRPESEDGDSDEVLDLVWDENGAGEASPVIVDGVPDVSSRYTLVDPIEDDHPTTMREPNGAEPLAAAAATPDRAGAGDARVTFKAPPPPLTGASGEVAALADRDAKTPVPRATTVQMRGKAKAGVGTPRQWATGTSPATSRPSRRELSAQGTGPTASLDGEAGESLTHVERPTRILTPVEIGGGIVGRRLGPSRVHWVVGAIAAGAVIGIILWATTRGGSKSSAGKSEVAAATTANAEPDVRQPIHPPSAAAQSIPTAAPLVMQEPVARAAAKAAGLQVADRKTKRGRDGAPAAPASSVRAPAPPIAAAAVPATSPAPPRTPSLVQSELRPLPVAVKEPPATRSRALAALAPSSAAPILVTPNRAHRRSGSIPILRGTRSANPIRAITAKLCVDRTGSVTSVDILSKIESQVRDGLTGALKRWRYDPIVDGGSAVPACFATTFRVTQK